MKTYIYSNKSFSMIQIPVHKISSELAEKLNVGDDSYICTTSIKLVPHDNKMDLFFNDQKFNPLESRLIKELPEITKGSTNRSEVEDHKIALIIDKNYKLTKIILADDLDKLGGSTQSITMRFSSINDLMNDIKAQEEEIIELNKELDAYRKDPPTGKAANAPERVKQSIKKCDLRIKLLKLRIEKQKFMDNWTAEYEKVDTELKSRYK